MTDQSANNLQKEMVSYYKIPVDYEIKGNFLGYIKFKRAVSKQKKMLNFDKETISVVQNDSTGAIVAKGELTIVGMPDEFFKILIFLSLMLIPTISFSDSHDQKKEVLEQVKEIAKEMEDDEEVP